MKQVFKIILATYLMTTNVFANNLDISLGQVKKIKIMVSCPSAYNQGEINAKSIIENFYIIGTQEKRREKLSGCQFNQAYPLFVENGELKMRVKWIDGSATDTARLSEMKRYGSVLIGKLNSNQLPICNGQNSSWFHFVDVVANPNLRVTEIIREKNSRHSHSMKFFDGSKRAKHAGWVTKKVRASRRAEKFCYSKKL
jgi:hypothetical protein